MKKITFLIVFALVFSRPLFADDLADVKNIVSKSIVIVIDTIKNKSLDRSTRDKKIIDTVVPFFDFEFMAKVCLGKKHWTEASPEKRDQYLDLFVKRLQESYLEKLDLYTDEEVVVDEAKKEKNRIHVITHLVTKDDKMEMIYKFRETDNGWLVYDIEILGVSIVQTYRSQFSGFLKDKSFDDLLENLKSSDAFKVPTGDK
ncbi:ABC transporter substrate-binding protein [bacterium]|nr:ABC transporter substrate-binding protein [bacterium]